MPPINLLIKPASSKCNMRCKYCFYSEIADNRLVSDFGIMEDEVLEKVIDKGIQYADHICSFAFQGGEPTIVGIDFYEKVLQYQKKYVEKYGKKNLHIHNAIQTNGYLINDEWAKFLSRNNFLVGLSLDGPMNIHDKNRLDVHGNGTFSRIMETVEVLKKYKVDFNILSVITGNNAQSVKRIYRFFARQGFAYLQFIPCLEPMKSTRGSQGYHLSVQEYGDFLLDIFDLWFQDFKLGNYTSIRHIDNLIHILLGERPEACNMNGFCSVQFVVEADGGVYPCDFYVYDQWKMGDIKNDGLQGMAEGDCAQRFIKESLGIPEDCKACDYGRICRNGCRRDRVATEFPGIMKNYYCKAFYRFFSQREKELDEVLSILKVKRSGFSI